MGRDLKKAIADYKKQYERRNGNEAAFYYDDLQQIHDMSADEYDVISNALIAGFMIGYRKAQRDHRKKQSGSGTTRRK